MLEHRAGHVGVQVEAGDDRHAGTDNLAHARQQFALAVVEVLADHRAMQVEIDAIDRSGPVQPVDQVADDALVRVARDLRGRRCRAPDEADGAVAGGMQRVQRAGSGNVGAREARRDGVAVRDLGPAPAILERGIIRLRRRKRIGLVLESADGNDSHGCSVCVEAVEVSGYRAA